MPGHLQQLALGRRVGFDGLGDQSGLVERQLAAPERLVSQRLLGETAPDFDGRRGAFHRDAGRLVTDFGYTTGLLTAIRDPLAADMVAAHTRADDSKVNTLIAYDGSNRVSSVTLPKAQGTDLDAVRPAHTYTYPSTSETKVNVAGLSPASGYVRDVTYDIAGRTLTDTDATAHTTTTTWNDAADAPASVKDPAGMETTTIYDAAFRPTDTYGPAPYTWFDSGTLLPVSGHTADVADATTEYDGGIPGLGVAYYNTADLSGATAAHDTGVGPSDGTIQHTWTAAAPATGVTATAWSAILSGQVTLPNQTGNYKFEAVTQGGVRLYIDDKLILNNWNAAFTGTTTADAQHLVNATREFGTPHPCRLHGPAQQRQARAVVVAPRRHHPPAHPRRRSRAPLRARHQDHRRRRQRHPEPLPTDEQHRRPGPRPRHLQHRRPRFESSSQLDLDEHLRVDVLPPHPAHPPQGLVNSRQRHVLRQHRDCPATCRLCRERHRGQPRRDGEEDHRRGSRVGCCGDA